MNNKLDRETLNLIHNTEQAAESVAGMAELVGRYYDSLPKGMPEELKQHLTLSFASELHNSVFGNPMLQMLDTLRDLGE